MTPKQVRQLAAMNARAIGPRVPGGTYQSAWSEETYTVEAIWTPTDGWAYPWYRIRTAEGEVRHHCTAWDHKRDRIISQP